MSYYKHFLLVTLAILTITAAEAQTFVSGIFQQTDARLEYIEGVSWEDFLTQNSDYNSKGYRLIDIETSGISRDRIYWGIYAESGVSDSIITTMGWTNLVKTKREMAKKGFVLSDITGFAVNENDFQYIGVWRKGDTPHKIWKLESGSTLELRTNEMALQNYYLTGVKAINTPAGSVQYLAIYHFNPAPRRNYVYFTNDPREFNTDWLQRMKSNIRLIDYDRFQENGETVYLGVYQAGEYQHLLLRDMEKLTFEDKWDRLEQQEDLQLVNLWIQ